MSLRHVDMGTESVNRELLLLALASNSSDIGAMLPWELGWMDVWGWDTCLGLRLPGSPRCPTLPGWKPPQSQVRLQHGQTHPGGEDENILST